MNREPTNVPRSWFELHQHATTAISAIIAVIVTLLSAVVGASLARSAEDALQLRQIKQEQYFKTIGLAASESLSMKKTVDRIESQDMKGALKNIEAQDTADDIVRMMAALPMLTDADVTNSGINYINDRATVLQSLGELGTEFESHGMVSTEQIAKVRSDIDRMDQALSNLLIAMRMDLGIPLEHG